MLSWRSIFFVVRSPTACADAHAGVVDEHVEAAVALAVRGDDALDVLLAAEVARDGLDVEALARELGRRRLELLRPAGRHRDRVALLAEHAGRSRARSRSTPPSRSPPVRPLVPPFVGAPYWRGIQSPRPTLAACDAVLSRWFLSRCSSLPRSPAAAARTTGSSPPPPPEPSARPADFPAAQGRTLTDLRSESGRSLVFAPTTVKALHKGMNRYGFALCTTSRASRSRGEGRHLHRPRGRHRPARPVHRALGVADGRRPVPEPHDVGRRRTRRRRSTSPTSRSTAGAAGRRAVAKLDGRLIMTNPFTANVGPPAGRAARRRRRRRSACTRARSPTSATTRRSSTRVSRPRPIS